MLAGAANKHQAAEPTAEAAAAAGGADGGAEPQHAKPEFSAWGDRSPRLQRCIDAAVEAGAPMAWLQDKYNSMRGHHMHHIFRTLCCAGPGLPVAAGMDVLMQVLGFSTSAAAAAAA